MTDAPITLEPRGVYRIVSRNLFTAVLLSPEPQVYDPSNGWQRAPLFLGVRWKFKTPRLDVEGGRVERQLTVLPEEIAVAQELDGKVNWALMGFLTFAEAFDKVGGYDG